MMRKQLNQLNYILANVESNVNSNAFILPVYNPGNDYRKIIPLDFSKHSDFFENVKKIYNKWFPPKNVHGIFVTNSFNYDSAKLLDVYKVGDYKFSIMPSKYDFNKLDRTQLNINPEAKIAIDVHSDDYSFIVYQFFQKGELEITPFGYLCEPYSEYSMIIPTIHGHPHNTSTFGSEYNTHIKNKFKPDFDDYAEFDHVIYTLVKNPVQNNIINKSDITNIDNLLKGITTDYINRKIRIYTPKSFIPNLIKIKKIQPNRNILIRANNYMYLRDLIIDNI